MSSPLVFSTGLIKSDKTAHIAMHKGSVLKQLKESKG